MTEFDQDYFDRRNAAIRRAYFLGQITGTEKWMLLMAALQYAYPQRMTPPLRPYIDEPSA